MIFVDVVMNTSLWVLDVLDVVDYLLLAAMDSFPTILALLLVP